MWELKSPTTGKAVDAAVRKATKQIAGNTGGVVLDFKTHISDMKEIEHIIGKRMKRASFDTVDVIIVEEGSLSEVLRYKK